MKSNPTVGFRRQVNENQHLPTPEENSYFLRLCMNWRYVLFFVNVGAAGGGPLQRSASLSDGNCSDMIWSNLI
jgi:hypothetical protein